MPSQQQTKLRPTTTATIDARIILPFDTAFAPNLVCDHRRHVREDRYCTADCSILSANALLQRLDGIPLRIWMSNLLHGPIVLCLNTKNTFTCTLTQSPRKELSAEIPSSHPPPIIAQYTVYYYYDLLSIH